MIRRIQALNYRCLRYVDIELDRFQVAVGPNASGKSTLLDVLTFFGDLVRNGVDDAVKRRTRNFQDLVWRRPAQGLSFELAIELDVPEDQLLDIWETDTPCRFRYEVAVREGDRSIEIARERGLLVPGVVPSRDRRREVFPSSQAPVETILVDGEPTGARLVLDQSPNQLILMVPRTAGEPTEHSFFASLGPNRSTLDVLADSPRMLPVFGHARRALAEGVSPICLEPNRLRMASPPDLRGNGIARDGSNLPWAVKEFKEERPAAYKEWMEHVRTTLGELAGVSVNEREDERTAYLMLEYGNGVRIPSWVASEGTLRFLLLTLIAYLPSSGIYLIEEPENGLHPFALDAVYASLVFAGESQVIAATHSLEFVRLSDPKEILCFAKDSDGATDIVRGSNHPIFRESEQKPDVRLLFATGTFG